MRHSTTLHERTAWPRGRKALRLLALASVLVLGLEGALAGQADGRVQPVAESALSPAEVVMGLIGYTRWPDEDRSLTVCITRTAADGAALSKAVEAASTRRPIGWRHVEADQALPADCAVVFFEGWAPQLQRRALLGLAQQPVLSIGWGAEFCSDGGLFCLDAGSGQTRFESNLEAVTRSGLRINAQVLRLTLPRKGEGT